jgi:acyl-CoA synthetase (NDP forming)
VTGPGIITNSGAVKGFALDFSDSIGFDVPRLASATVDALKAALPSYASLENPVDITAHVLRDLSLWPKTAAALLADPDVGSLCLAMVAGTPQYAMDKFDALAPALARSDKPAVVALLGDDFPVPPEFLAAFRERGVPVLRSIERALRALGHATAYGQMLAAKRVEPTTIKAAPLPGRGTLPEYQGKQYLAALGIPIPEGALAREAAEAKTIAQRIGYPVALKAQAAALAHKTDAGGVALNITDNAALEAAWNEMHARIAKARPNLKLDGLLVERMCPQGIEMIVGARRDPDWGPVVLLGLGGIWTEALKDVRLLPADVSHAEIVAEIERLKGAQTLHGLRGAPPVDIAAVADVVSTVAALMRARPKIHEIDINPLVAYPNGVLALDALIVAD